MLYLAWRQRFGKASPPHRPYQRKARSHKTLFQGNTTTESCLPKVALEFPPSHNGFLPDWPQPPLQQPEGSPTTSHQNPDQQTTGNQPADHSNPTYKLPCFPHNSLPSEAPRCIRHRSALHQPLQRAAQAHAVHCLSRSGKMGTDRKHIIRHPALRCHAPHPRPGHKRSVPRPPGHAFTPYKDRRPTSRLTSHHKKKQSFT